MGYEVHIVRKNNYDNDEASNITIEEWKQIVDSSPELTWKQFEGDTKELDYQYGYLVGPPRTG